MQAFQQANPILQVSSLPALGRMLVSAFRPTHLCIDVEGKLLLAVFPKFPVDTSVLGRDRILKSVSFSLVEPMCPRFSLFFPSFWG